MTTKAISSQGVKLKRGDGAASNEVFTTIGEVLSFTGPTESAKQIDVTSLDSSSREYIAGLRDGGEVSFDFNLVCSDLMQRGIKSDLANRVTRNWTLELTDDQTSPTKIAFAAIVTSFSIKGTVDDRIVGSCSLKISGDATWTYHTAS